MKKFINGDLLLFATLNKDVSDYPFINKELFEKLFCDEYDFPVTTLISIAEYLGVEVGDLFVEKSVNIIKFD